MPQSNPVLLSRARRAWESLSEFRRTRERNKRYCYGDQWSDVVTIDGETMTEREYIERQGSVPLKSNLIRRLVRNVIGIWRSQDKQPVCTARDRDEQEYGETMSTVLQYNWQLNRMDELNARCLEEFLISSMAVQKKTFGQRNRQTDCWTDLVQPDRFFIDERMRDVRGWDVQLLGEVHDMSFKALCAAFARSAADCRQLAEFYPCQAHTPAQGSRDFGQDNGLHDDFLHSADSGLCRVIEVWTKENRPFYYCHDTLKGTLSKTTGKMPEHRENAGQPNRYRYHWNMEECWHYTFLTPEGTVLCEGDSPYAHGAHPYVFKLYPYIDGELHSFVADVIDQQRHVNRLITLYDWAMRSSAKGVLLFPEDCLVEGMTLEDVAAQWSRFNGMLAIRTPPGKPLPQQISNNNTNIGIRELLNFQLKFFEDISGVNGALQGKPGYSNMSGTLYAQQTQNSTNSLLDILGAFSSFVTDGAGKDVKNIQQFYRQKRVFNIAGRRATLHEYDPDKLRNVDFDLSITENVATPAYRQAANEWLLQLHQQGVISTEQLLKAGAFPYADTILHH